MNTIILGNATGYVTKRSVALTSLTETNALECSLNDTTNYVTEGSNPRSASRLVLRTFCDKNCVRKTTNYLTKHTHAAFELSNAAWQELS
jgi:hypothetical protein